MQYIIIPSFALHTFLEYKLHFLIEQPPTNPSDDHYSLSFTVQNLHLDIIVSRFAVYFIPPCSNVGKILSLLYWKYHFQWESREFCYAFSSEQSHFSCVSQLICCSPTRPLVSFIIIKIVFSIILPKYMTFVPFQFNFKINTR